MIDEEDDPLHLNQKISPWIYRLYGIAAVGGAIFGFFSDADGFIARLSNLIGALLMSLFTVGLFIQLSAMIIVMALNAASKEKTLFFTRIRVCRFHLHGTEFFLI